MALFCVLCWAFIFILCLRFLPDHSVATILKDLADLKSIFLWNGCPGWSLNKLFDSDNSDKEKFNRKVPCVFETTLVRRYLRKLFWKGFEKHHKKRYFFSRKLHCIFSTRTILPPTPKDSLPVFSSSCIVGGSYYTGRTTEWLSERIKQDCAIKATTWRTM